MSVGKICVTQVDIARPDESVRTAAQRMHARKVGSLVVTGSNHVPVGLVTDRDLVMRVLSEGLNGESTVVGDVMTLLPHIVYEDTSIEQALALMRTARCRLPVVDNSRRLVGTVSLDDIIVQLTDELKEISRLVATKLHEAWPIRPSPSERHPNCRTVT